MGRKKSSAAEARSALAAKKEAVLGRRKSQFALKPLIIVTAAVLAVGGGVLVLRSFGAVSASVPGPSGDITYPVSPFDDGKARHYDFQAPNGITVKYFVIKSSDGVIRAAFDACDVCWPAGKGYQQQGDYMVCRNCGRRFASVSVNVLSGGCNPAPLERKVVGDQVVLRPADIAAGSSYFDLPLGR